MRILITTLGRVGYQTTLHNLRELGREIILVVQKHEAQLHAEAYPQCKIVDLPDHIRCIGDTRQFLSRVMFPQEKILLLDDDLTFYWRPDPSDWHLKNPTPESLEQMFQEVEDKLDDYAHVGVSGREGNNREPAYGTENVRFMRMVGYNTARFPDPFVCNRVDCLSDFDTNLQLLSMGLPSYVFYRWAQGQPATQLSGGCSINRSHETHSREVRIMAEMWPGICVPRIKVNKTGGEFGQRDELTIYWKTAYQPRNPEEG